MPGYTTHYLLGIKAFHKLTGTELQSIIKENRAPYRLGLAGPDIYFYYLPTHLYKDGRNIGGYLHTHQSNDLFRGYLKTMNQMKNKKEKQLCTAYVCGFLCHYVLDYISHPYIYWKTNKITEGKHKHTFGTHSGIETQIDAEMLKKYKHISPCRFSESKAIRLTKYEFTVLADFISESLNRTYGRTTRNKGITITTKTIKNTIRSSVWESRFLLDPAGKKKKILSKIEQHLIGYPLLSGLMITDRPSSSWDSCNKQKNPWFNPWKEDQVSHADFFDLFNQALNQCIPIMTAINSQKIWTKALKKPQAKKLLKKIGNNSYHTGLPLC